MNTAVMTLLAEHVPLSLLLDLAPPGGPDSAAIMRAEPADTSWVRDAMASVPPAREQSASHSETLA